MAYSRKFQCPSVGRLIVGQVKNQLQAGAFRCGVTLTLTEGSGFLERPLWGEVSGDKEKVDSYCKACHDYFKRLNED